MKQIPNQSVLNKVAKDYTKPRNVQQGYHHLHSYDGCYDHAYEYYCEYQYYYHE